MGSLAGGAQPFSLVHWTLTHTRAHGAPREAF